MVESERDIAVVIPTLNEVGLIGALLTALRTQGFEEIVVADGGSADGTCEIVAATPGVRLVRAPPGRGGQINAAVRVTRSPIILILHADTALPPNASQIIRIALAAPDVVSGCFRLAFDTPHRLLAFYAWASRFETGLTTFGDQAYFIRRAAFDAIGGAPDWPLLEDVALRERLRRVGRFVKVPACVVTSARRFTWRGVLRGQFRNIAVLAGYRMGIPVSSLAAFYGSKLRNDARDVGAGQS